MQSFMHDFALSKAKPEGNEPKNSEPHGAYGVGQEEGKKGTPGNLRRLSYILILRLAFDPIHDAVMGMAVCSAASAVVDRSWTSNPSAITSREISDGCSL